MGVKMRMWRPWPPLVTKKYEVKLTVRRLEFYGRGLSSQVPAPEKFALEIRWKGHKIALSSLRRSIKRNLTKEEGVKENGTVFWDEKFQNVCSLSSYKENMFHPWEIGITVCNGLNQSSKNKVPAIGTTSINLADFASVTERNDFEVNLPLTLLGNSSGPCPVLYVTLSLLEMRTAQEPIVSPVRSNETISSDKNDLSALKAGFRKVKIFTGFVSSRRSAKKTCREGSDEGRCSTRSEDGDYTYPFDSDSLEDFEDEESGEQKDGFSLVDSFNYGTLAYVNGAREAFYRTVRVNSEEEDWIYYSNRRSDVGCSAYVEGSNSSVIEPSRAHSSKLNILSWRKRKLSFRSPKPKGEPLLKNGEDGGDDIDFDRRQLNSDESLPYGWYKSDEDSTPNRSSISDFGDDHFTVGSWEQQEVISRDGQMKLATQVFFASIDQRSEKAAGESACTALVAVIADWFQANRDNLPNKSQFDGLIREGSFEWRKLCKNQTYMERFPDKHFDLETVLESKIRPISVNPGKSFVGFFHPEGINEEKFEFLQCSMSFDSIWDEITEIALANVEPRVFIVSWNDHFFVLKVEPEAYYIIDTLGERLHEGCNQAYILKFDKNTTIHKLPSDAESSDKNPVEMKRTTEDLTTTDEEIFEILEKNEEELEVVCKGMECCKEYIKSFLAAIPIRELLDDLKKGLMASTPLHHRLQIEFNFTQSVNITPAIEPAQIDDEVATIEEGCCIVESQV